MGWTLSQNYGTCLQAFALYRVISSRYSAEYIKSPIGFLRYVLSPLRPIIAQIKYLKRCVENKPGQNPQKMKKITRFMSEQIAYSPSFMSVKSLQRYSRNLKCIITGSDQIWNPYHLRYINLCDNKFFPDSVKRISYSSSIGVTKLPSNLVSLYTRTLSQFSHISLREFSGVDIVSRLLNRNDIVKVVDPVFLLSKEQWDQVIILDASNDSLIKRNYMLCYFVGDNSYGMTL